jgi:uncharacterized repeat protein (TIGR01451 family)
MVGLDSNDVTSGPNNFPVGARVCNIDTVDTAANVVSVFVWDSSDAYINLRPGSLSTVSVPSLAPGACTDFYYEVEVTRNAAAYNHTRRYHITATADGLGTVSTSTPRELFVEHLISQSRNATLDVKLDGASVPAGATMSLMVGQSYTISLVASTATQGYEQIENFINFPNTIFQILSVQTSYSADTSATVENPSSLLYGDGCRWENDPNSPNYRACLSTGKAGGLVTTTYQVRILSVGSTNPQPLSTLIYDFSGSSFHYNADISTNVRYAYVVDPTMIGISKSFSPDPTNVGGISTLSITLTNPTPATINGLNFTDALPTVPGAMVVATPPDASTTGCGTPTFAPVAGSGSISFSNGTLAPENNCTIKVNVTMPVTGTYLNTTGNLFIGTTDTDNSASDTVTVNTAPPPPACVPNAMLAQWTMTGGVSGSAVAPTASFQALDVSTASASYGQGLVQEIDTGSGNPAPSLMLYGWAKPGPIAIATSPYYQFQVDTSRYTGVRFSFDASRKNNGPTSIFVYYSTDGSTWLMDNTTGINPTIASYSTHTTQATTGTLYYRIYGYCDNATSRVNDINVDNITLTGCAIPRQPTLSKSFSPDPIAQGSSTLLTFTIANPNSFPLTNVRFTDTLPAGLAVVNGVATQCGGTLTRTAPTSLVFAGGTLAAGASCTVTASVTAANAGVYDNVSAFIEATYSVGTLKNITASGYGSDTLTVLDPPAINKSFAPDPILPGEAATLTFVILTPNPNDTLTGVQFTDTFPATPGQMVVAAAPTASTSGCGTPVFAPAAGAGSISFSSGSIAPGGTCTVRVNVTAPVAGEYSNLSSTVQATISGVTLLGNTATDDLTVNAPHPALAMLKQIGLTGNPTGVWTKFVAVTPGTPVYYRFIVENTGDVNLSNVTLSDPALTGLGVNLSGCTLASLPRYETAVCVAGPVTAATGLHPNTASAQGSFGGTPVASNTSTASYATAALTLVKSAVDTYYDAAGDVLHYTYRVTNSGNAPLAGPVVVSDNLSTDESCPSVETTGDLDAFLDPGESLTCAASYTVTAADVLAGSVTNLASASAGGFTSNTDSETVPYGHPALTITKNLTAVESFELGATLSFGIVVTNTGDLPLTNLTVSDPSAVLGTCSPAQPATLAPGAAITCPAAHVITQADVDLGSYANTATADSDQTESATATVNVIFVPTAVELNYFRAARAEGGVMLTWETVSEATLAGFNLYRRDAKGEFVQVNDSLIPPQVGGQPFGSVYFFLDGDASTAQRYEYRLEGIETDLAASSYATVTYWPFSFSLPLVRR